MKFLLVNAHKWYPVSPPAALDYVAGELEKADISSQIVDLAFMDSLQELELLLKHNQYDGICLTIRNLERTAFSEKLHFPLPSIRNLVQVLKKYCHGPIIVGGSGFSILPERILQNLEADYGIFGGGEEVLPLLVKYVFQGEGDIHQIPHLVYQQGDIIRRNPCLPYQKRLPQVKRGYLDYHLYFRPGFENFPGFASVETKRGCPHSCIYCVEPEIKGQKVRIKDPEDVSKEIDWFVEKGISYFFLADSEFNTDCDAALSLLKYWKVKEYSRKIKWIAYATPSNFSEELAQLLPESGNLCTMIDFGHICNSMLSTLGKSYTSDDVKDTLKACEKYRVPFRGSLILGGPGENRETIKEAITFFKEVNCKIFVVLGIRVFPHTPLGEMIKRSGPLIENPNLYGKVIENDDLLEPVYYISHELGEDIFNYLSQITGDSEQFYTVTSPFNLKSHMCGHFRGSEPEYETIGRLDPQYITNLEEREIRSSIFDDEAVL